MYLFILSLSLLFNSIALRRPYWDHGNYLPHLFPPFISNLKIWLFVFKQAPVPVKNNSVDFHCLQVSLKLPLSSGSASPASTPALASHPTLQSCEQPGAGYPHHVLTCPLATPCSHFTCYSSTSNSFSLFSEMQLKNSLLCKASIKVKVAQSCPPLCDPMDNTVHGILQPRILEWVAFLFSRKSS